MMMNMYVMLMLMLWDVNACLTPRGVTISLVSGVQARRVFLGYPAGHIDSRIVVST
jgi:hypothetical protein